MTGPVDARSLLCVAAVGAVVAAALLGAAAPATAHGYHLAADPQVSDDGTVVVASAFAMLDGFVALHADADGGPGDAVGHVPVERGFHTGVEVTADAAFWDGVAGNETIWAAVHRDDGDGEFDPETDVIASFGGTKAAVAVPVRKSDRGRTYVVAGGRTQEAPDPTVYVRRVGLAEDGFLVLRSGAEDRVVGHVALDAGTHRQVAVPLDEAFFASTDDWLSLEATVYRDDGDGEFTDRDAPVAVDGSRVAARLTVEKTNGTRVTPSAAGSPSPGATATPTPRLVTTATPTVSPTATPTASPTDGSSTVVPGFTVAGALAALAVVLLLRRSR